MDFMIGFLSVTGAIFWILCFAWAVGYIAEKLRIDREST